MKLRQSIWLLASLLWMGTCAQNQQSQFNRYGVADGLSQSSVSDVFIDEHGMVWIATHNGLNRFNGLDFEIFVPDPQHPETSIGHGHIRNITSDDEGNLWMGTGNGLSVYNPQRKTFTNFIHHPDSSYGPPSDEVNHILCKDGKVWFGSSFGLSCYHVETDQFQHWRSELGHNLLRATIRDMEFVDDTRLLLVHGLGLTIMDTANETFEHILADEGTHGFTGKNMQSVFRDSHNRYWIGGVDHGVYLMTGTWDSPHFTHFPPGENGPAHALVFDVNEDSKGRLWMATYGGVTIYDPALETWTQIQHDENEKHSLWSDQVYCCTIDAQDRVWLGALSGLNVYDPYINQVVRQQHVPEISESISADNIFEVFEDSQSTLWIGNYTEGVTAIVPGETQPRYVHFRIGMEHWQSNQVLCATEDAMGRIWIGTFGGVHIIDWPNRETDDWTVAVIPTGPIAQNALPTPYIYNLTTDDRGTVWVGTYGQGVIAIRDPEHLTGFVQLTGNDAPVGVRRYFGIVESMDQVGDYMMVGHVQSELLMIDTHADSLQAIDISHTINLPPRSKIHAITHSGNHLVLGTDQGLIIVNDWTPDTLRVAENRIRRLGRSSGLTDDVIYTAFTDEKGIVWFATTRGMYSLDPESGEWADWTNLLGDDRPEFNYHAGCRTAEGEVVLGTVEGLIRFNPDHVFDNPDEGATRIHGVKVIDSLVPTGATYKDEFHFDLAPDYLGAMTFDFSHKILTFELESPYYTYARQKSYACLLEPFDQDWRTTPHSDVTYTNLSPGEYTLHMKSRNSDGRWGAESVVGITILPPWYRTWWALLVFAMLGGLLIWSFFRLRLQRAIELQRVREEEREEFRKRSSMDFHDEAGNKMTRVMLLTELASRKAVADEEMSGYLSQINTNIRDLNSGMRDFIWALDPKNDSFAETVDRIRKFGEDLFQDTGIRFEVAGDAGEAWDHELNMSERRHLILIMKEAMNNALKHSGASGVVLTVAGLSFELKDNGNGFSADDLQRQNGMTNMRERAAKIGAILTIKSSPGAGTLIRVEMKDYPNG